MSLEPFARSLLPPPSRIRVSFLSSFPLSFPPSPLVPFGSLLLGFAASVAPADAGDGSRLVRLAGRAFYDDVSLKGDNQPKNGRGDNRGMAVIVLDALTRYRELVLVGWFRLPSFRFFVCFLLLESSVVGLAV